MITNSLCWLQHSAYGTVFLEFRVIMRNCNILISFNFKGITYTRGDQPYELQKPHFGRQIRQDPCISKSKYFNIFMVFSVHPKSIGWFQLDFGSLSLGNCWKLVCACVRVFVVRGGRGGTSCVCEDEATECHSIQEGRGGTLCSIAWKTCQIIMRPVTLDGMSGRLLPLHQPSVRSVVVTQA
jgi:hypothetical protein